MLHRLVILSYIILNSQVPVGDYVFDTYIASNKVKSVLCVPILNQNVVVGILYLENNLLSSAFTQDRVCYCSFVDHCINLLRCK